MKQILLAICIALGTQYVYAGEVKKEKACVEVKDAKRSRNTKSLK
jgi:hypothetical protein